MSYLFKLNKRVTNDLIRYVTSVKVTFNPFDKRTTSAKETIVRFDVDRYYKSNSKFKVDSNIVSTPDPPSVEVNFVDGSEIKFDSQNFEIEEMIEGIFEHAGEVEFDYEKNDKVLD